MSLNFYYCMLHIFSIHPSRSTPTLLLFPHFAVYNGRLTSMDCTSGLSCPWLSFGFCVVRYLRFGGKEDSEVTLFLPRLPSEQAFCVFLLKTTVPSAGPLSIATFFWFWKLLCTVASPPALLVGFLKPCPHLYKRVILLNTSYSVWICHLFAGYTVVQ